MKKFVNILNIILLSIVLYALNSCVGIKGFIYSDSDLDLDSIPIYDKSSKIKHYIKNKNKEENYFIVSIYKKANDYVKIRGNYAFSSTKDVKGWISIEDIRTNLISELKIPIHKYPNHYSCFYYINSPQWYAIEINDIKGKWVLILYETDEIKISGWIETKYICGNPYTTCN